MTKAECISVVGTLWSARLTLEEELLLQKGITEENILRATSLLQEEAEGLSGPRSWYEDPG